MTTNTAEIVRATMQAEGLGSYYSRVGGLITRLDNRGSRDPGEVVDQFLRDNGYTQYRNIGQRLAEAIRQASGTVVSGSTEGGFDRDRAAQVIEGAARNAGIDPEDVASVLIEAGLRDEPTDEVAADGNEVSAMRRDIEALKAFARRHGFNG